MANGDLKGGKFLLVIFLITVFLFELIPIASAKSISGKEAEEVKTFLKLSNVPVLRNLDEDQLKKILTKTIKPEIPDFTYGLLVLSAKDDLEWIDMILSQSFLDRNKDYFNSVLDKRLDLFLQWKKIGQDIYFFASKKDSLGPLAGLASETVDITNKTIEVFVAFDVWKTTKTYKGIWRYFDERRNNYSHEEAWIYTKAEMGWAVETKNRFSGSGNSKTDQVEAQLITLWDKWGPYATPWGISEEYKKQVREELNNTLVMVVESQSFAEEEQKLSLLDRMVKQLEKIKDVAVALTSQINPFRAGPVVELSMPVASLREITPEFESNLEPEVVLEPEPEPANESVDVGDQQSEPEPVLPPFIEPIPELAPEPVLAPELIDEPVDVEDQQSEPEPIPSPFPAPVPEPIPILEPEPELEPVPEQVFCERTSNNPTRFRVFINEIAWMGTADSSNDEWIELKNIWGLPVNLSGWQLLDKDKQIKIIFDEKDIIPANGFYLLERTDDDTLPNITADFIYTGALSNTDEALYLFDDNCQLEDEVVANPNWPAGDNIGKKSMERLNPLDWHTSSLAGTAKSENTAPPAPSSSPAPTPEPESMPQSEQPLLTVVINEIAWMGTSANSADEWIELYNNTALAVDLTGWRLVAVDGSPDIIFSTSTIAANDFYLIERTDDNTVSDIIADLIYTGVLNNNGEKLELRDADNNLIDVVDCSNNWFGGEASPNYTSMERIDSLTGNDPDNWGSNNRVPWEGWQGKDADNNRINGTPKSKNSISKNHTTVANGGFIVDDDFILTLFGSPYLVWGSIKVLAEAKLTIEPGVTIKFKHSEYWKSELKVEGELTAVGTATEKIIFTSSSTNPLAGDWEWLYFKNSSSTLKNVIIQYAGKKEGHPPESPSFTRGAVYIEGGNVQIENSTIEQSKTLGIWLKDSSLSVIDNVTFSNIIGNWEKPGMAYIESGSPTVKNSNFNNGNVGIWIEPNASSLVQNNAFQNNTIAIKTLNLTSSFSGNTAQNNSLNGILVSGFGFSSSINEINWQKANLPYVFESYTTIASGKILNIKPGTIIKFKAGGRIYINGTLKIEGTDLEKIILTSFNDDEYGGDTNNDGVSTSPHAGYWDFISFSASSTDSVFDNVVVRYGGSYNAPFKIGAIKIENTNINVSNSLFENNLISGLELNNCTTTITNTVFKDHRAQYGYGGERSKGIWVKNAALIFSNTAFSNNYYGIYVGSGDCPDLSGVSFGEEENTNTIDIWPSNCSQ